MDDKTTVATKGRTRFNCCGTVFEGTHAEMQDAAIGHKCATVESFGVVYQQNSLGDYVVAIPEPFVGAWNRNKCGECLRTFNGREAYRGHYALVHILGYER